MSRRKVLIQPRFFKRDRADVMASAGLTETAFPQSVKVVKNRIDKTIVAGPDADLEVASAVGLGPEPGSGEIGAPQVHPLAIYNGRFGMQARATSDCYRIG